MKGLGNPNGQQPPQPQGEPNEEGYVPANQLLGEVDEGSLEQASPEEQAQFEQFETTLMRLVYPEDAPGKVNPQVMDNLNGRFDPSALEMFQQAEPALTDSPQDSAAATAVLLTLMIEGQAEYTDDVVLHGGKSVVEEMIEIAEAAKIHDFSDRDMETVTYRAMDLYRISSPRADPAALTEAFKELMAANEQGNLAKVLPGLPGGPALKGA